MDNENRYLIDHNGTQIKLDEKHLKILESHRILERWKYNDFQFTINNFNNSYFMFLFQNFIL